MLNFFKNLSPTELIILLVVLVLLFGSKAAISLAKTAGKSYKEIRNIKKNFQEAVEDKDSTKKEV